MLNLELLELVSWENKGPVGARWPLGPTSRRGREIIIHNSIIWIWGRKHAILREKLHRVLGSRSWNHGLNGELCPEHFQKVPRNFCFFCFLGSADVALVRPPPSGPVQSSPPFPVQSGLVRSSPHAPSSLVWLSWFLAGWFPKVGSDFPLGVTYKERLRQ